MKRKAQSNANKKKYHEYHISLREESTLEIMSSILTNAGLNQP